MKKIVFVTLLFVLSLSTVAKEFELPMPTKCEHVYTKRVKHFERENKKVGKGGVVMLGDSITQGFRMHLAPKKWNLINRGISGDCIGGWKYQGAFDRLDVSVHAVKPSKVFIALGTNDTINWFPGELQSASKAEMLKGYKKMIREIQAKNEGVEVYIQSVFPIRGKYAKHNKDVLEFNEMLKGLAKELKLTYVDLHAKLIDDKGELKKELTGDGVHLKTPAYKIWIAELKKYLD